MQKREQLRSSISFSCVFQRANISAQQKNSAKRICESVPFQKGRLRGDIFLFSCMFQRANISAQRKVNSARADLRVCSVQKGSDCAAEAFPFSCTFQRANISAQQKSKLCKSSLRVCSVSKKERLRGSVSFFLHVSTSKYFCAAE